MLDIDSDDLNASVELFMENYTAIDLLNYGLQNQSLMKEFLTQNGIKILSTRLPGIIVQVYLLVAKKFNLNVFGPLTGEVGESLIDNVSMSQDYNADDIEDSIEDVLLEEVKTGTVSKIHWNYQLIRVLQFYILTDER